MDAKWVARQLKAALDVNDDGVRAVVLLPELLDNDVIVPWKQVRKALDKMASDSNLYDIGVGYDGGCVWLRVSYETGYLRPDLHAEFWVKPKRIAFKERCKVVFAVKDAKVGPLPVPDRLWHYCLDEFDVERRGDTVTHDVTDALGITALQKQVKSIAGERLNVSRIVRCKKVRATPKGLSVRLAPGPVGKQMLAVLVEAKKRAQARGDR